MSLVVLLALGAFLAPTHLVRAVGSATLQGTVTDAGLDTDGDGLYNYLVLETVVDVTEAGEFWILASSVDQGENVTYLGVGQHVVGLRLKGWKIWDSGADGPYSVQLSIWDPETYQQLDSATYNTSPYVHTDFDPPDVIIEPPFSDAPVDLNDDGLYDELWINFTANITATNTFQFWGSLSKGAEEIASVMVFNDQLTPGFYLLTAKLPGPLIRQSGLDGPYSVSLYVHSFFEGIMYTMSWASHTTAAYASDSFNEPWARFVPWASDEGRDEDGDGLFDYLVLHVPMEVVRTANVSIQADIPLTGRSLSARGGSERTVEPGNLTWELTFEGMALYADQKNGPYEVRLFLRIEGLGTVNRTTYTTGSYGYAEFEKTSAEFGPSPTPALTDEDGDGRIDLLEVQIPVEVREAGDYLVTGDLRTSPRSQSSYRFLQLEPGSATVTLTYSGIALSRTSADGPWQVDLTLGRLDSSPYDAVSASWTTPTYTRSQFESLPMAVLSGTLRWAEDGEPVRYGFVVLADPSRKFWTRAYPDETGSFQAEVYNGTFSLTAGILSTLGSQSLGQQVTVQDGDNAALLLEQPSPASLTFDIEFLSWNESRVVWDYMVFSGVEFYRAYADLYGDFNGFAEPGEVSFFGKYVIPGVLAVWMPLKIVVDNRTLDPAPVAPEYMGPGGTTETTSSSPLSIAYAVILRNATAAEGGAFHNITLSLPYDLESADIAARVSLPSGFTGTVVPADNVTVTAAAPGTWDVNPGGPPAGLDNEVADVVIVVEGMTGEQGDIFGFLLQNPFLMALAAAAPVAGVTALLLVRRRRRRGAPAWTGDVAAERGPLGPRKAPPLTSPEDTQGTDDHGESEERDPHSSASQE